jgi:hypothetical protein
LTAGTVTEAARAPVSPTTPAEGCPADRQPVRGARLYRMTMACVRRMPIPVSWVPKGWDTWDRAAGRAVQYFGGEGPNMPGSRGEHRQDGPMAVFPPASGRAAAMPRLLDLDGRGELTAAHVRLVAGTGVGEDGADGVAVAGRCPGGSPSRAGGVVPFHGHRGSPAAAGTVGRKRLPGSRRAGEAGGRRSGRARGAVALHVAPCDPPGPDPRGTGRPQERGSGTARA